MLTNFQNYNRSFYESVVCTMWNDDDSSIDAKIGFLYGILSALSWYESDIEAINNCKFLIKILKNKE